MADERRQKKLDEAEMERQRQNEAHFRRMASMNAKATLDESKYCSIFSVEEVTDRREIMQVFSNWYVDFEELDKCLDELGYTSLEKYLVLKGRLDGSAKRNATFKNPTSQTYKEVLKKLENLYVNKSLEVRDVF